MAAADFVALIDKAEVDPSKQGKAITAIVERVRENALRVADLGHWTSKVRAKAVETLLARIPQNGARASGFDAGIACALDLIPRDRQQLSAMLHANYTADAIMQVRQEAVRLEADSQTCWWLAACSELTCDQGEVTPVRFLQQVKNFSMIAQDQAFRKVIAEQTFSDQEHKYRVIDGVPFVVRDGGMQAAYLHGFNWGVEYGEAYSLFFVSTALNSLGVFEREFPFSSRRDERGRAMSGKLSNDTLQRCKCSSIEELAAVVRMVRENLGDPKSELVTSTDPV
jgi:hypothetical protein